MVAGRACRYISCPGELERDAYVARYSAGDTGRASRQAGRLLAFASAHHRHHPGLPLPMSGGDIIITRTTWTSTSWLNLS